MPSEQQCKKELLGAFDEGAEGKTVSTASRSWLSDFCDGWLPNPPNAGGKSVAEIWDVESGRPPANGQKFKGRFKKIGKAAASKCDAAGTKEITETDVETATKEVISQSSCPFCPDE